jgi:hypothetical protein
MDKERKQQIILIILIPVFLLGLFYTHMQKASKESREDAKVKREISEDERIGRIPKPNGFLDTEYTLSKKDPLKDLFQLYLYRVRLVKSEEKLEIPLPKLTIEGIIWNSDMPQAIVDGRVVRIGDVIKNVEIVNIEKKGITVSFNGEKVLIKR